MVSQESQTTNTVVLAASLIVVAIVSKAAYNLFVHPLRDYPGPLLARASRLYYAYYQWQGSLSMQTRNLHCKYGDCFRIAPDEISYSNAEAWQEIYGQTSGRMIDFEKDRTFYPITPNGIDSIITARTDEHRRLRRLLSHPLSERALAAQETIIMTYVDLLIEKLQEHTTREKLGGVVEMVGWFTSISFDILGDLAFGEAFGFLENGNCRSWNSTLHTAVRAAMTLMTLQRFIPGVFGVVTRVMQTVGNAMSVEIMENFSFCARKARARMNMDTDRPDFMTYILGSSDAKGLTPEEVEASSHVLIDAGTETVATALSGIFFYLISSPSSYQKLVTEIRTRFHTSEEINLLSTQSLPYLRAVIQEGMRIYPPSPGTFPRTVPTSGAMICGRFVPGGYSVGVNQLTIMRSVENFRDPTEFIPERWMDDERFASDKRKACQPFSYGTRSCIGKSLAYAEMKLVLTKILWNFDVELQDDSKTWDQGQKINMYWEKGNMNVKLIQVIN